MTADVVELSTKAQLIQTRLGWDLTEWVQAGRADGRSWRVLAAQIHRLTGVSITHQALHNWYSHREDVA